MANKLSKQAEKAIKALNLKELHNEKALRYTFSKIGDSLEIPNLIKVQIDSYNDFLTRGIGEVFKAASPIVDHQGNLILEFFGYRLEDETKYDLEETKSRSLTYSKRLYANVRLINKETGEITPETTKKFIKKVQIETKEPSVKTPTVKTALNTGVDSAANILPILSLIGMTGGIVLPNSLKKKD